MADVSGITAVRTTSNTIIQNVQYGATIAVGQVVYVDVADNEHKLADADGEATSKVRGIAVTPGVDGGYGIIATGGTVVLVGATLTQGAKYVASDTAGGIKPNADLATGEYVTDIGRASSSTNLDIDLNATGITAA